MDNGEPRSHELAALLDVSDEARLGDDAEAELRTRVDPEWLNPARSGEFCNGCQSRWEDEQRAKALSERRAVNAQRGF
ncbi:MAG TPA: hypothetical protein VFE02_03465 [Candidatus Acidoferrales bacterium]|nr:hypothetical protein [Candidatus Acidoferrales bacterium]